MGVEGFVLPGVDQAGWEPLMRLCSREKGLYAAPGLHPLYLALHRPHHLDMLKQLASCNDIVAIGEIGLDFFHPESDKDAQMELFEHQLAIAKQFKLPLLLHVRKAHDQVLSTLRRKNFPHGGIVHAFSGSLQQAKQYIELGFGIGVCGNITYDRARRLRRIVTELDRNWLVLETDAPDLPLASHRGEANLPEYLPEILDCLAQLRSEGKKELARITTSNVHRLLNIGKASIQ